MINLAIGIAIGAAFAPFWMMVWGMIKSKFDSMTPPAKEEVGSATWQSGRSYKPFSTR